MGCCFSLEVTAGFEPADNGVADRGLTTWLRHHAFVCLNIISKDFVFVNREDRKMSEKYDVPEILYAKRRDRDKFSENFG